MQRRRHYAGYRFTCVYCYRRFGSQQDVDEHVNAIHFGEYTVVKSAFARQMQVIQKTFFNSGENADSVVIPDVVSLREREKPALHNIINGFLKQHLVAKVYMSCEARFVKYDVDGTAIDEINIPLSTRALTLYSTASHYIDNQLDVLFEDISTHVEAAKSAGSGLSLKGIMSVGLNLAKVKMLGKVK